MKTQSVFIIFFVSLCLSVQADDSKSELSEAESRRNAAYSEYYQRIKNVKSREERDKLRKEILDPTHRDVSRAHSKAVDENLESAGIEVVHEGKGGKQPSKAKKKSTRSSASTISSKPKPKGPRTVIDGSGIPEEVTFGADHQSDAKPRSR